MKKNNYLNKKEFHQMIKEYQNLSDDTDDSWLKKYKDYPRRKLDEEQRKRWEEDRESFKEWKYNFYKEKRERFEKETEAEKRAREKRFFVVSNRLGEMYMKLIDGVLQTYEFNNHGVSQIMKDDMKGYAAFIMYRYTNKFDIRRKNPFAFFTEVAKNACRKEKHTDITFNSKFIAMDFYDELDEDASVLED